MSRTVIRTEADAERILRILQASENTDFGRVRFEGFPSITISALTRLNFSRVIRAQNELQRFVRRLYATFRYGDTNTRRLTREERRATEVEFDRSPDGKRVTFDLAAPFNAIASKAIPEVVRRALQGDTDMFSRAAESQRPTNICDVLAELGNKALDKVSERTAKRWGYAIILTAGICLGFKGWVHEAYQHDLNKRRQHIAQQQLPLKSGETIVVKNLKGDKVHLSHDAKRNLDAQVEAERRVIPLSIALAEAEAPLVSFVRQEVEAVRPLLLELAMSGTINVNGVEMPVPEAKRFAKESRQRQKLEPAVYRDWKTSVRRITTS